MLHLLRRKVSAMNERSLIFWVLGLSFIVLFIQKMMLHYGFHTYFDDLFYYDHSIWEMSQGRGHLIRGIDRGWLAFLVHEGNHFSPFLLPFVPLYSLIATPFWIMLANAVCGVLTMWPLLLISAQYYGKKGIMAMMALMVYFLPFRLLNLIDMKGDLYIGLCLAWTLYLLINHRIKPALIVASLALLAKENAFLFCGSVGVYVVLFTRYKILGALFTCATFIFGYIIVDIFLPKFSYFDYYFLDYYSYLGDSTIDKLITIFTRPDIVIKHLFTTQKIFYVFILFAPIGFLPFFSRYILLGAGFFAQNILSSNPLTQDITFHHSASLVPLLLGCTILGFNSLHGALKPLHFKLVKRSLLISACFFGCLSALHWMIIETRVWVPTAFISSSHAAVKIIPDDASVSASAAYSVHLTYRPTLHVFPTIRSADYVIVEDIDSFWPAVSENASIIHRNHVKKEWAAGNQLRVLHALYWGEKNYTPVNRYDYAKALEALKAHPNYTLIHNQNRVLVFKRRKD